jgi:heme/copper-type cytochrome/quinol oxidase subunit 3
MARTKNPPSAFQMYHNKRTKFISFISLNVVLFCIIFNRYTNSQTHRSPSQVLTDTSNKIMCRSNTTLFDVSLTVHHAVHLFQLTT